MGKGVEDANTYRVGHPLAQRVLALGRGSDYAAGGGHVPTTRDSGKKIAILEPLVGQQRLARAARA